MDPRASKPRLSGWHVLLGAAIAGALLGAITFFFLTRNPSRPAPVPESAPSVQASALPSALPSTAAAPLTHPAPSARATVPEDFSKSWAHFQDRFGDNLQSKTSGERLTEVRGTMGQGRIMDGFHPNNPERVKARAREVIEAASSMLGIRADMPLGEPILSPGEISAQATFVQTYDGVEVAPVGGVRVSLGPQGELLGVSSSYQPGLKVTNTFRLTEAEAAQRALTAIENPSAQPGGATRLVWIVSSSGPVSEGRCAYQFYIEGVQIIVDADNGGILFRRNRRSS